MCIFIKVPQVLNQKILQANLKFIVMLSAEKYPQNKKVSITADHFTQIITSSILQYFLIDKIYEHY